MEGDQKNEKKTGEHPSGDLGERPDNREGKRPFSDVQKARNLGKTTVMGQSPVDGAGYGLKGKKTARKKKVRSGGGRVGRKPV